MILVIGDGMLDRYVPVRADGISAEWPMPRFREDRYAARYVLGGAANVAANIASLGEAVTLLSPVGKSQEDLRFSNLLVHVPGLTSQLFRSPHPDFHLPVKTRFVADGRQVFRVDQEEEARTIEGHDGMAADVLRVLDATTPTLVVVSDYNKGCLTASTARDLVTRCKERGIPILVDAKPAKAEAYTGATAMTPNDAEFTQLCGPDERTADFDVRAQRVYERLQLDHLIVTRGRAGLVWVRDAPQLVVQHMASEPHSVRDTTGAGDTFLAALAVRWGGDVDAVAAFANYAAGLSVTRAGTATVTAADMARIGSPQEKVLTPGQLEAWAAKHRAAGHPVVVTNGCFDVLHPGHTHTLEYAATLGSLLVLINSDASVKRLKGENRPLQPASWRSRVIAAMAAVDAVCIFDNDKPLECIEAVRPDVLVKGGTTDPDTIPGADFVRAYGGRVELATQVDSLSTTEFEATMRETE
jgi:D-beta-D-heptose 7-phosphate kinase/D-beta-D-heptose 1-phosphate adenosyltransferase